MIVLDNCQMENMNRKWKPYALSSSVLTNPAIVFPPLIRAEITFLAGDWSKKMISPMSLWISEFIISPVSSQRIHHCQYAAFKGFLPSHETL
jgi:hypothetical protein